MKILFRLLLLLLITSMILPSCKKDEDDLPVSRNTMLVGTWKMTASTVNPARDVFGVGSKITDIYAQTLGCKQDDIMNYTADWTFTFEEGGTKCNPNDPQIIQSGTWSYNGDQTFLIWTTSGSTSSMKIKSISSSYLILTYKFIDSFDDLTYTFEQTYQKY